MLFLTVDALRNNEIKVHCDGKLSMLCRSIHLEQEKLVMYIYNVTTSYTRLQQLSMLASAQQQQRPVVGLRKCWCKVGTQVSY